MFKVHFLIRACLRVLFATCCCAKTTTNRDGHWQLTVHEVSESFNEQKRGMRGASQERPNTCRKTSTKWRLTCSIALDGGGVAACWRTLFLARGRVCAGSRLSPFWHQSGVKRAHLVNCSNKQIATDSSCHNVQNHILRVVDRRNTRQASLTAHFRTPNHKNQLPGCSDDNVAQCHIQFLSRIPETRFVVWIRRSVGNNT